MTYAELTTPWDRVREHYSMLTLMRTAHAVTGLLIALATWAVLFALITPSLLLVWTLIVPIVGVPLLLWAIPC
ncbi:hypothetical protein [Thermocatellispora tengchongensis]|uniref:hypothetical protein n=1 Tax=Thermocatellispora tengchongensis TaxID=1073253 RepID=UPI0036382723